MVLNETELWGMGVSSVKPQSVKDYWGQGKDNESSRCAILTCELVQKI